MKKKTMIRAAWIVLSVFVAVSMVVLTVAPFIAQ